MTPKNRITSAWIFLLMAALLSACESSPAAQFRVEVSGEINRTMDGGELFLEDTPGGKQIYIQRRGRGEQMQVLQVSLPETIQEGEYLIYPNTPVTAGYWDRNNEGSWIFDVDSMGKVVLQRDGDRLRGTIDFTAGEWKGDGSVQVHAEFWDVPYPAERTEGQATPGTPGERQPETTPASGSPVSTLVSSLGICAFLTLLIANFVIQLYVGRRVYPESNTFWLPSLNGTRTFIRGWKLASIRPIMLAWSAVLGGMLIMLCGILALTAR